MFGRAKLSTKLLAGFGVVMLITLIVGVTGVAVGNTTNTQARRLAHQDLPSVRLLADLSSQAGLYRMALLQYVLEPTLEGKAEQERLLTEADQGVAAALAGYLKIAHSKSAQSMASEIKNLWAYFSAETPKVLNLGRQGRSWEAASMLNGQARDLFRQIEDNLKSLRAIHEDEGQAVSAATDKLGRLSRLILFAVTGLGVLLGIGFAFTLSRSIIRPLRALAGTARALADGDLTVPPIAVKSKDEIGEVAESFNRMQDSLRTAVTEIAAAAQQVAATSEQLTVTAESAAQATTGITEAITRTAADVERGSEDQQASVRQAAAVVEQLDDAIQQIARGSQEQAKSVNQTSSVLSQVASAVQQVAATAQNLVAYSTQTSTVAEKGGLSVQETIAGMQRISQAVNESSERIQEMGDYSKQIGQIVDVISEIANQTNLLALNAAIEAARAGEHGKGFAVVADAVRSLAERSSHATKEIGALISSIQGATQNAVRAMQVGTEEVQQGGVLSQEAGRALEEILKTVEETHLQIQTITAATEQIAASSTEAVKAMDMVAAVTEESTAATQQMAAGSSAVKKAVASVGATSTQTSSAIRNVGSSTEEMSAAVEEVASSAASLSTMAQQMQQLMSRFKW